MPVLPLFAVFAGCHADFTAKNLTHANRFAEAGVARDFGKSAVALDQFAFGTLDTQSANLGGDRSLNSRSPTANRQT